MRPGDPGLGYDMSDSMLLCGDAALSIDCQPNSLIWNDSPRLNVFTSPRPALRHRKTRPGTNRKLRPGLQLCDGVVSCASPPPPPPSSPYPGYVTIHIYSYIVVSISNHSLHHRTHTFPRRARLLTTWLTLSFCCLYVSCRIFAFLSLHDPISCDNLDWQEIL